MMSVRECGVGVRGPSPEIRTNHVNRASLTARLLLVPPTWVVAAQRGTCVDWLMSTFLFVRRSQLCLSLLRRLSLAAARMGRHL